MAISFNWISVFCTALGVLALITSFLIWLRRSEAHLLEHSPSPLERGKSGGKLSSHGLAVVLAETLVENKLIPPTRMSEAADVVTLKIELLKALGTIDHLPGPRDTLHPARV